MDVKIVFIKWFLERIIIRFILNDVILKYVIGIRYNWYIILKKIDKKIFFIDVLMYCNEIYLKMVVYI